jgi:hypothetical protein
MGRRHSRATHPRQPTEERLSGIVAGSGCPAGAAPEYLAFAREFLLELRREVTGRRLTPSRVAEKWFKRGLSGRLLWQIGSAVARETLHTEVHHGKNA